MNDFDLGVMRKIQELHRVQGKYPTQMVVPDAYVKHMTRRAFFFYESTTPLTLEVAELSSITAISQSYSRVQVDVVSESENAVEKRQRERMYPVPNLWDF